MSVLERLYEVSRRLTERHPILDEINVLEPRAKSWQQLHDEGLLSDDDYAAALEFIANPVYYDDGERVETWRRMASRVPSENGRGRVPLEWPWD